MGVATSFTSDRMLDIEQNSVIAGLVDVNGNLILEKKSGATLNAGKVKGDKGDQGVDGETGIPAGSILAWSDSSIPNNWLLCDGQTVSRSLYSDLFAIIGTRYGLGNGTTTFNLPDLRGRVAVGMSNDTEFNTLGKKTGNKVESITAAQLPAGVLGVTANNGGFSPEVPSMQAGGGSFGQLGRNNPNSQTHNNIQPSFTLNYIIKATGGIGEVNSTVELALLDRISEVEALVNPYIEVPIVMDRSKLYMSYSERNNTTDFEDSLYIKVIPNGPVTLSGLAHIEAAPDGTVIGQIPSQYAPEYTTVFSVENGDNPRTIRIEPNGNIKAGPSLLVSYLSFDGISYIPKNVGVWTQVTSFATHFEQFDPAIYGPVSCYKDSYGFTWWRGMLRVRATGATDSTPILNYNSEFGFPSEYIEAHMRVAASNVYGCIGVRNTSMVVKSYTSVALNATISLGGIVVPTQDAFTINTWTNVVWMVNGWANYPGAYPPARHLHRKDGMAFLSGFIRSGTLGAAAFIIPDFEMSPKRGSKIIPAATATGRGRMDVGGLTTSDRARIRRVFPQQGGNGWYSIDGIHWAP